MTPEATPERPARTVNLRAFVEEQFVKLLAGRDFAKKIKESVEGTVMDVLSQQSSVTEEDVRRIVGESGGGGGGGESPADLDGKIEAAVRQMLTPEALRPAVEPLAAVLVTKGLKREGQMLADELKSQLAKAAAGGGGGGGADPEAVKATVREMLKDEGITRDEVEELVRKARTSTGARAAPGLTADQVREVVREEMATLRGSDQGWLPTPKVTELVNEVLRKEAGKLVQTIRQTIDGLITARESRLLASAAFREAVDGAAQSAIGPKLAELKGGGGGGKGASGADVDAKLERAFRDFTEAELPRSIASFLEQKLPLTTFDTLVTRDELAQAVANAVASGGAGGGGGGGGSAPAPTGRSPNESQVFQRFLSSNELKEMLDDKFRLMTTYLKSELVPKLVKDATKK